MTTIHHFLSQGTGLSMGLTDDGLAFVAQSLVLRAQSAGDAAFRSDNDVVASVDLLTEAHGAWSLAHQFYGLLGNRPLTALCNVGMTTTGASLANARERLAQSTAAASNVVPIRNASSR